jgi:hypothetical protein
MDRRRRTTPNTSMAPSSPPISKGLLRLVGVTARTALDAAQEIGGQLLKMTRATAHGARSASLTVASDLRSVAQRAAGGTAQGLGELGRELARFRMRQRPMGRPARSRRPTAIRGRRSRAKTAAT